MIQLSTILDFLICGSYMVGLYLGQIWLSWVQSGGGFYKPLSGPILTNFAFLVKTRPQNFLARHPIIILEVFSEREHPCV